ncbi:MAG TPA: hypothetical protein VMB25_07980 [Bryobacteraceae bacterium]|nr:hypothetical protein [Bryobacteraceae bacterium]
MLHLRLAVALALVSVSAHAQWLNYKTPGTPRLADGKPDLSAPAPRTAEGVPDLSGVWMHEVTTVEEVKRLFGHAFDQSILVDVPGMEIGTQHKYAFDILLDYQPEAAMLTSKGAELLRLRRRGAGAEDPASVCTGVAGFPLAGFLSEPIKIVQAPRLTLILYEVQNLRRQIYTDGRTFPKEWEFPAFMGYSIGTWDHDTFVVETAGFNDRTTLDTAGHPHGEQLHVTERFRRRDFGHLDVDMTFDDPEMYTKPFTIKVPYTLMADADIFEDFCENEKDRVHLKKQ